MSFKRFHTSRSFCFALSLAALLSLNLIQPSYVQASTLQQRDFLTDKEADHVREAQVIDRRILVFIKIIERRIAALNGAPVANSKQALKDAETWGALRTGTRAEMLSDIARTLDAAITNIDEAATRAPQNPLTLKALRKLAEASTQLLTTLNTMRPVTTDVTAREALEQALDNARTIIQAASALPAATKYLTQRTDREPEA